MLNRGQTTGIAMNQQPAQQSTKQSIDQETQQSIQHVTTLQQWRRETLFTSAADYYADLLEHIACARRSIILESYIFELDTIGKPLLHSLCLAAERGVKVKLLIDGIGSYQCASEICRQLH